LAPLLDRDSTWLFNAFAGVYAWFTAQSAWRASCGLMAAYLPDGSAGRPAVVIDLGCGPGVSIFEMARRRPDALYVGLDRSDRMLDEARRRQRRAGSAVQAIRWVRADASALPFPTASVDALTGHSFLYLLGEPARSRALPETVRVLRPGGRIVLMEPSARPASLRHVLAVSTDPRHLISVLLWRPFSRLHVRHTPESLRLTLEQVGFVGTQVAEVLGGLGLMACGHKPAYYGH
jgi:ubiquinone/menaquinone biosynthesis C-methylase UbiE